MRYEIVALLAHAEKSCNEAGFFFRGGLFYCIAPRLSYGDSFEAYAIVNFAACGDLSDGARR